MGVFLENFEALGYLKAGLDMTISDTLILQDQVSHKMTNFKRYRNKVLK